MINTDSSFSFLISGSSTADWSQDADFSDWVMHTSIDLDIPHDSKRWWSNPDSPLTSKPLYRTTTYPQQQPILSAPSSPSPTAVLPLLRQSSVPLNLQLPPALPTSQLRHAAAPYNALYNRFQMADLLHHQLVLSAPPYSPSFISPAALSNRGVGSSGQQVMRHKPKFRSKYMTSDEIEGILRNLQSAGHASGDPYADDYYHQACLAKRQKKVNFRPATINEGPVSHRGRNGHHDSVNRSFTQTDSLGRISFTNLRRPRVLLQPTYNLLPSRPLDQELLVAARVTIEDGFYLLLEVEDIDRFLLQDGSSANQLRRRRQVLLEGLAASLQLVDPLGRASGLGPNDDLIFLRLTTLTKGQKLIAKFLNVVNGDLARKICMTVFRHLRSLYGAPPLESTPLIASVTACVGKMDLSSLSACLVAVVCSSEQPPFRPSGGATVMVEAVLDRATQLLNGPLVFTLELRSLWQASFNAFFGLLSKYCVRKYEAIVQSLTKKGNGSAEMAAEVRREMPVDLLRASLPHTDKEQQVLLKEFARRSLVAGVTGFSGLGGRGGDTWSSEFVPG